MANAPAPSIIVKPESSPFRGSAQVFSPPWLSSQWSSRLVYCQSLMWDTLTEWTRQGVRQRYPTIAEPSALSELGKDRKIWRGIKETDAHYAERLRRFKRTWKFAGNAPTLLTQLWEYMRPDTARIRYVVNGYEGAAGAGTQFADWWTIDDDGLVFERVSPSNWDWDGRYGKNVRFWIIVYRADVTPAKWGVPPYEWAEPGLKWAADPDSDTNWVIDTFNIVEAFKAAGSHMGPWPSFDGGLIIADPSFTTAPWGVDGPFPPSAAPGFPMPDGTFEAQDARPAGAVYVSGL